MVKRHLFFWLVLMLLAIANGILRETLLSPRFTELAAHQLSTLSGIVLTGLVAGLFARRWPLASPSQAWLVGICWLMFTLLFEFTFGHYVAGHSWARLLQDYNLSAGRVWPLFLLWVAVMPYLFYRLGRTDR